MERAEDAEAAQLVGGEQRIFKDYALRIPESKVGRLDLRHFRYQEEALYGQEIATAEEACIRKSTQTGVSTAFWRWGVWRADQYGDTVIYFFPTKDHVTDFSVERIEPSIQESEYLLSRIPEHYVSQQGLKRIGIGWIHFRGINSFNAVQSVAADALVFDEYDDSDDRNVAHAERRIGGARAAGRTPRVRRIGRPSLPGYGIDAQYEQSDKRVWLIQCPSCGTKQEMTFADNLRWQTDAGGDEVLRAGDDAWEQIKDVTRAWRECASCGMSLEPKKGEEFGPIHEGEWRATAKGPGRQVGYFVPRLIVPRTDLREIIVASRATSPSEVEVFHNADLGMPFASEDDEMTDFLLDRAMANGRDPVPDYSGRNSVTMGVDVASARDMHVRISEVLPDGTRRALMIREVAEVSQIKEMMDAYRVSMCVIDSMPERRATKEVIRDFPGRAFHCDYSLQPNSDALRVNLDKLTVQVNRTEAIDAMYQAIRERRNAPLTKPPRRYREQMKSLKRRLEEDTKGRPHHVYIKTGSYGDDYAHAEVYDLVAGELLGMVQGAQQLHEREGELGPEELGYEPVRLSSYNDHYDPGFG